MKPHQQPGIAHSRVVRRDEATRRTASSRSITEYDKWIEGIRLSEGQFGKPGYRSPGAWSSRIMSNSKSMPCNRNDERFHWHENELEESDHADQAGSPVVPWRKSPTDESSLMLHDHGKVYSAARTQEIADYRKEMMDMVRGLPESDFELTLQDIVEKRKDFNKEVEALETPVTPVKAPGKELARNKETKRKKNQRSYVIVERSKSIDTGLLARMFSPLSVVARRKSLNLHDRSGEKEVEERNKAIERKKNSKDEEWWKKNEFSEKGSNSSSIGSSTSNDSGSGSGSSSSNDRFSRNMSMKQTRCSCFRPGKIKIRPGKMKPKSS